MDLDIKFSIGNPVWYGEMNAWYAILNHRRNGNLFHSPLREDQHASCVLLNAGDHHILYDRARKASFSLHSIFEALKLPGSVHQFMRECAEKYPELDVTVEQYDPRADKPKTSYTTIKANTRQWEKRDAEYWKLFDITINDLEKEHYKPINEIQVNGRNVSTVTDRAYCIRRGDFVQVCFVDRNKQEKWLVNGPTNGPHPISNCNFNAKVAFVLKGVKDAIAFHKNGADAVYYELGEFTQNTPSFQKSLKRMLKTHQVVLFIKDADDAGIAYNQRLLQELHKEGLDRHTGVATIPSILEIQYGFTDPTDMIFHGYKRLLRSFITDLKNYEMWLQKPP